MNVKSVDVDKVFAVHKSKMEEMKKDEAFYDGHNYQCKSSFRVILFCCFIAEMNRYLFLF